MARATLSKMSTSPSPWHRLLLHSSDATTTTASPSIPTFLYGTAWKKDQTADLVYKALSNGFRGVDTAAQPKHYREDLVGDGIRRALAEGKVRREDIFLQTKYTSVSGQDPHNMPYDPSTSIANQIHASLKSSFHNLRPQEDSSSSDQTYLDALILHSPLPTPTQTLEAWRTFEEYVPHRIRHLGISNVPLSTLEDLYKTAKIKPSIVQNRFYPNTNFDVRLRQFCQQNSIIYQSFWTLTANPAIVWSAEVGLLANQVGISTQAAMYCLVLGLGGTVLLNGTKNEGRMVADLEAREVMEKWAGEHPEAWGRILGRFKKKIGEV